MTMYLPLAGREYAHGTVVDLDADVDLELLIDDDDTPHAITRAGSAISVLLAGPDATDNPDGTIVLTAGTHALWLRAPDNPEIVVRFWGRVYVS